VHGSRVLVFEGRVKTGWGGPPLWNSNMDGQEVQDREERAKPQIFRNYTDWRKDRFTRL